MSSKVYDGMVKSGSLSHVALELVKTVLKICGRAQIALPQIQVGCMLQISQSLAGQARAVHNISLQETNMAGDCHYCRSFGPTLIASHHRTL